MKKTARNHDALADRYEYKQGQFYYVDYSGPFEISRQGNHDMVLFVDRHTRIIIGFFVKKKDEATAIEIIKQFIKEYLAAPKFREQGSESKVSCSCNQTMESFTVKRSDFTHRRTAYFNAFPAHTTIVLMNGPVEHAIQRVKIVRKCMLEDRRMPQLFWQDAASMAIFVLNRTPNRYEGEWQREALYQMFRISTDYSRFRIRGKFIRNYQEKKFQMQ